jgi:phosphoenolpyruvate synthase/pyruvate phosphate dikinase
VVGEFKKLSGKMPQTPDEQLEMAIMAVFSSWFTPRAVRYRCVFCFWFVEEWW